MSDKEPVWALGAMSGTSLDGVDAALVLTDGGSVLDFGRSGYRAYSDAERAVLKAALGQDDPALTQAAAEVVELAHAELLSTFPEAEIVGFHGQTLWHRPDIGATCQAGDGRLLAEALERPVVWDFRSSDMVLGGQGAPLAPFFHFALARWIGADAPLAFLNIGGVANLTWIDPGAASAEAPGALLAFDTGPGNARIDDLVAARVGARMDADGALTLSDTVDEDILGRLLSRAAFFAKVPPKSLDRDDFADWSAAVEGLSTADAAATLAAGTVGAIAHGLVHCPKPPKRVIVCGGGRRNAGIMELLAGVIDARVEAAEAAGLDGDMIEAQAFAYLAVRVEKGLPTSAPGTTGVAAPVGGGRISRPGRRQGRGGAGT